MYIGIDLGSTNMKVAIYEKAYKDFFAVANSLEKDNDIQKESMQTLEKKFGDNYRKLLFREDSNGNKIYMIMAIRDDHYQWYMIILDKDGELPSGDSILELDLSALDALSCSIDAFMAQNNWE